MAAQPEMLPDVDLLPHNIEAEAALLGALMIENNLIDATADELRPEHFFEPVHGRIFSVIVNERNAGRLANPITLRPQLEHDEALKMLGGPKYLATLTASSAAVVGARDFAIHVKELALRRLLIGGMRAVIDDARRTDRGLFADNDISLAECAARAEGVLAEIVDEEGQGTEEISAGKAAMRVVDNLSNKEQRNIGVRSGIDSLDAVLGPLRPKSCTIVAARPGMGKSALAISYAIGAAKRGEGVLFINLEMDNDDIAERALADICFDEEFGERVPFAAITSANVSIAQARTLARGAQALDDLPIQFVDIAAAGPAKISRLVRRYKRRFEARGQKLTMVIVDYLQLMSSDQGNAKPYDRVSEASRGLKRAAKENGVAMMALCQLSRDVERRADKRPVLADLRDSGQIEQDADAVLFLLRPEYYLELAKPETEDLLATWEDAMRNAAGVIEFIVAKRRRGKAATGRGFFASSYQAMRT